GMEKRIANRLIGILKGMKLSIWMAMFVFALTFFPHPTLGAYHFSNFRGKPPIHVFGGTSKSPQGMTPDEIKAIYHLPQTGGKGTIAIIGAYNDSSIEKDLGGFDVAFNLPACTKANGCFEQHLMGSKKSDSGWALETTLDVEWAHAIAPSAKILL